MCRTILIATVLVVLTFIASLVAATRYLGCWAIPIVILLWALLARFAARFVLTRLALLPYTFPGRALSGARTQIHAIDKLDRPAPARHQGFIDIDPSGNVAASPDAPPRALPAGDGGGPEIYDPLTPEDAPARELPRTLTYRLDLTITPRHAHAAWHPAALTLVPASATLDPKSLPTLQPLAATRIELSRTFDTGQSFYDVSASHTCTGPQHLRLTFELPLTSTETSWKLLYHFLSLTPFRLPQS